MALLLAPYNDAMRLGMGFNSFTQQLCINDAVRPEGDGRHPASNKDLRPQYRLGTMIGPDGGNVDISQDVTWTAKFVDKISEVTDSLNVSGTLQIKCDAIGGGGKASADFIDTNKFKESDINYFIQVKVTNQRFTAPNLTKFDPIPHVSDSEFTRVYGDCFISGFTEGGEFNALISIKIKDRSKAKEIKGQLELQMDFKAVQISGSGAVEKQDAEHSAEAETTISVSWRGGGDIKDATVSDWTLENLKSVAMEFPEHVMACPMRTNAILTKYTGLKSFYETVIKGSPLDYENAGVYSSALLDAYMDYKVMWRNIQQNVWEVEQSQSALTAKGDTPAFAKLSLEAKANFQKQMARYQQKLADHKRQTAVLDEPDGLSVGSQSVPPPATTTEGTDGATAASKSENETPNTVGRNTASGDAAVATIPPGDTIDGVPAPSKDRPIEVAISASSNDIVSAPPATITTAIAATKIQRSQAPPPPPPMPPNDLVPYEGSILGLDKARRDCRFEMIKIVQEVDAVADDPKVACDPDRAWQYLSPAIFRMLLPSVKNLDKEKADQIAAEEAKNALDTQQKSQEQLNKELTSLQRKLEETTKEVEAQKKAKEQLHVDLASAQQKAQETEVKRIATETAKKELEAKVQELNPHKSWCPVGARTSVRIRSYSSRKCMDYDYNAGGGGRSLHQYDAINNANQKFEMLPVGPKGYSIRHIESGKYLAISNDLVGNSTVFMCMSDFPSIFVFEWLNDGAGTWNGLVMVRFAEQNEYTLNVWGASQENGAKLCFFSGGKGDNDKWWIKPFDDYST